MRLRVELIILLAGALALAACGGKPRVAGTPRPGPSGAAGDWPVKVGNPYQVMGQWFHPKDDHKYDRTGIASWYGPGFHGLATANGERYNMNMVSAAHTTLPLPSYVEVTNLENGKTLVVRVNDRGPFVSNRIIDLSQRSAELLDMKHKGTARVRVRRVYPPEEVRVALRSGRVPSPVQMASVRTSQTKRRNTIETTPAVVAGARPADNVANAVVAAKAADTQAMSPQQKETGFKMAETQAAEIAQNGTTMAPAQPAVRMVDLPPSSASVTASQDRRADGPYASGQAGQVEQPGISQSFSSLESNYIQVAALSDAGRASWLAEFLKSYGRSVVQQTAGGLHRVRLGPYASVEEASVALAKVQNAGYQEARIVTDRPSS